MKPIMLGEMRVRKFVESAGTTPVPVQMFVGMTDERFALLRQGLDDRAVVLNSDMINFSMHSFVIEAGGKRFLIDTCNGDDKHRSGIMGSMHMLKTNYLANLAALGLKPADIDAVLCTHLHSDHVGWNTRLENGKWVPTFPNARYLMSRGDFDFYGALPPDHPQYGLTRECYTDSVLPVIEAGQAELVESGHVVEHEVGNGIWLEGAPGHTPGSMLIHAQTGSDHAVFSGDVFHHPLQIQDPAQHIGVDTDLEAAFRQRKRIIETYADTSTILLAAHFPDPTAGRIVSERGGRRFAFLD